MSLLFISPARATGRPLRAVTVIKFQRRTRKKKPIIPRIPDIHANKSLDDALALLAQKPEKRRRFRDLDHGNTFTRWEQAVFNRIAYDSDLFQILPQEDREKSDKLPLPPAVMEYGKLDEIVSAHQYDPAPGFSSVFATPSFFSTPASVSTSTSTISPTADNIIIGTKASNEDAAIITESKRRWIWSRLPKIMRPTASKLLGIQDTAQQDALDRVFSIKAMERNYRSKLQPSADTLPVKDMAPVKQAALKIRMVSRQTDFALWEYMENCVFSLVYQFGMVPSRRNMDIDRKQRLGLLARQGTVYPALALHGMQLFDGHFGRQPSPLALAVLPRVKALGFISYVLGAGTALYNELLRIHWARYGDAFSVFALLEDMRRASVPFDRDTQAVLTSIKQHLAPLAAQTNADGTLTSTATFGGAAMHHLQTDLGDILGIAASWSEKVEHGADRALLGRPNVPEEEFTHKAFLRENSWTRRTDFAVDGSELPREPLQRVTF